MVLSKTPKIPCIQTWPKCSTLIRGGFFWTDGNGCRKVKAVDDGRQISTSGAAAFGDKWRVDQVRRRRTAASASTTGGRCRFVHLPHDSRSRRYRPGPREPSKHVPLPCRPHDSTHTGMSLEPRQTAEITSSFAAASAHWGSQQTVRSRWRTLCRE